MRIGVLGSGRVGRTLGQAFAERGHPVVLGTRRADDPELRGWAGGCGVHLASVAGAAAQAEVAVNATAGVASVEVLQAVSEDLAGTVLIDVANPLDFSRGFPPSLTVPSTDSLAERIQAVLPRTDVVKALSTVTAAVMVDPARVPGEHHLPIAGNDPEAKATVRGLLVGLGWPESSLLDLGDLSAARGMEAYLLLWVRLMGAIGSPVFNLRVVGEESGL
jgi:predicted dinucleotide-binding enzyme